MIGSGRCHGPGCTQTAVVADGFCSESCQARWNGQFEPAAGSEPAITVADLVAESLRNEPSTGVGLFQTLPAGYAYGGFISSSADVDTVPVFLTYRCGHVPKFAYANATSPQVAPKDPQVGFVRRWLDRLTGRHT